MTNLAHIEVNTLWAMSASWMQHYRAELSEHMKLEPNARAEIRKAQDAGLPVNLVNGTAEIRMQGPLSKRLSLLSYFFGGTSYLALKASLNAAVADKAVNRIMLHIESPGGSVSGMKEAGQAIAAANEIKPVTAYIDDLGASAAYYLATYASEIRANDMAEVGSIGVYTILYDDSEMFDKAGIKVIEATTSQMKLIGAPGVPITDAMQAEVQKHVDEWGNEFFKQVMSGRSMTEKQANAVTNGKTFIASEAMALGLIDGISSFEDMRAINNDKEIRIAKARTARARYARMKMQ